MIQGQRSTCVGKKGGKRGKPEESEPNEYIYDDNDGISNDGRRGEI